VPMSKNPCDRPAEHILPALKNCEVKEGAYGGSLKEVNWLTAAL